MSRFHVSPGSLITGVIVSLGIVTAGLVFGPRGRDGSGGMADTGFRMNGKEYSTSLREPKAFLQEDEAGFNTLVRLHLNYDLAVPGARPETGLEISVNPEEVQVGEEMLFGSEGSADVTLSYYPNQLRYASRGVIMEFAPGEGDGGCLLFSEFDPQPGGRIRGELVRATLQGQALSIDSGEPVTLDGESENRVLKIAHLPFDATIGTDPSAQDPSVR
jgi:hypothetical protein